MTKKNKAWSMPDEDWIRLESQPNQSEFIRRAIARELVFQDKSRANSHSQSGGHEL
jgi:hypothetical protein